MIVVDTGGNTAEITPVSEHDRIKRLLTSKPSELCDDELSEALYWEFIVTSLTDNKVAM